MSQPLIMSFRADAADMCLSGLKRETRRPLRDRMSGLYLDGAYKRIDRKGRKVWQVGELIMIKRSRTGKGIGKVECVGLNIENIQDIDDAAAIREGMTRVDTGSLDLIDNSGWWNNGDGVLHSTPREAFRALWDRLYPSGPFSWVTNPRVVVIKFEPEGKS